MQLSPCVPSPGSLTFASHSPVGSQLWRWRLTLITLIALAFVAGGSRPILAATSPAPVVRLPGHVLDVLKNAKPLHPKPGANAQPLTLTLTLRRADQAGFDRYLQEVYDPHSPQYRHFLSQRELTARFGPTRKTYDKVLAYLRRNGFRLLQGSANRLTLTMRGSRAQAERAFQIAIGSYSLNDRTFYANNQDPALPVSIAETVESVDGLSNLARSSAAVVTSDSQGECNPFRFILKGYAEGILEGIPELRLEEDVEINLETAVTANLCMAAFMAAEIGKSYKAQQLIQYQFCIGVGLPSSICGSQPDPAGNQKIGLLEFDTFHESDVANWLALLYPAQTATNRLSAVPVNGGVASPGPGEPEVLVDVDTVMELTFFTDTQYVVYDAPNGTGFQQVFNAMINDGDTIISNSWSQCEDQTTLANAQSIDSILAQAAASGISVFNSTGDAGATCGGSPSTINVPADSPHATAVGGTTPIFGPAGTYGGETWWNGSAQSPPTGAGGYGVSKYFPRPSYQSALTTAATRSVPDVAVDADPRVGLSICQADAGGCPTGRFYGGTSMAAPLVAGQTALLNILTGSNIGEVNPVLYPLAGTNAFYSAASMGTDFAHVGLGSPSFDYLRLTLSKQAIGPASASKSLTSVPIADLLTPTSGSAVVKVNLYDANNYPVSGKTVTLAPSPGTHAAATPAGGVSSVDGGSVVFTVTDTMAENVTFTATDVTDGVTVTQTATIGFVGPPATSGSITASPTSVPSDGTSAITITVTLLDANGNGTPGKTVTLSQGGGHSIVTAPNLAVTDANGQIQFTATDDVAEIATYTAVDATDSVPVPGSAIVTFSGPVSACAATPPTPASGFTITPFATGFVCSTAFNYSNINFGAGFGEFASFDTSGNLWVADVPNGNLYKLGPGGGAATSGNIVASPGVSVWPPVFESDGSIYTTRVATGSGHTSGEAVQIDPGTGALIKTIATGLSCPSALAVDPLSGDLFFADRCGAPDPNTALIWRITNPASPTPGLTVYATLPSGPNEEIAFAPNGTLYVVGSAIVQVGGTNTASPPMMTTLPIAHGYLAVGGVQSDGAASSLIVYSGGTLQVVNITTTPFTSTTLATGGSPYFAPVVGPDGCVYLSSSTTVYKLCSSTGGSGGSGFFPSVPAVSLSPLTVSPNPAQGTPETFTATLSGVSAPQGTPIIFTVSGANSVLKMVPADGNGVATFTYSGVNTGIDNVVATATVGSKSAHSSVAQVTWKGGIHTTFLSLNLSPTGATVGRPAALIASLSDVSVTPAVPLSNASITLTLDGLSCNAVTNSSGIASCSLTPGAAGLSTLSASFPGAAGFLGATASTAFSAVAAATAATPAVSVTPGSLSITTLQPLSVTVTVSGGTGTPAPTGSVILTSGSYTSAATTLSSASATITVPAGSLSLGSDTLTAGYTPDSNSSSTYLSATGTSASPVTVTLATPTLTVTPNSSSITTQQSLSVQVAVSGGTGNPTPTGSATLTSGSYTSAATGLSSGSATITVPAGTLSLGIDTLTVTYSGDSIYNTTSTLLTVTVSTPVAPYYSLTVTPYDLTISRGQTGQATLTVNPVGGFKSKISFACSGLPAYSTCSFSPLTVTPDGTDTPVTSMLTIATDVKNASAAAVGTLPSHPDQHKGRLLAFALLLGLPGLIWARRRFTRGVGARSQILIFVVVSGMAAAAILGCGANTTTPRGTELITVTANGGGITQTFRLTLTVQ